MVDHHEVHTIIRGCLNASHRHTLNTCCSWVIPRIPCLDNPGKTPISTNWPGWPYTVVLLSSIAYQTKFDLWQHLYCSDHSYSCSTLKYAPSQAQQTLPYLILHIVFFFLSNNHRYNPDCNYCSIPFSHPATALLSTAALPSNRPRLKHSKLSTGLAITWYLPSTRMND